MRLPDFPYHLPHLDLKAALAWAASFLVGLHLPQPTWGRAFPTRFLPLFGFLKGATTPMTDINTAFEQGRAAGLKLAATLGTVLGLVEGLMPGADAAAKHEAFIELAQKEIAAGEHAIGLPDGFVSLTTNHDVVAWIIERVEAFAVVPAAPAPAVVEAPAPEAPEAPETPATVGEAPAAPAEGV